jgi:hypothetical protein
VTYALTASADAANSADAITIKQNRLLSFLAGLNPAAMTDNTTHGRPSQVSDFHFKTGKTEIVCFVIYGQHDR